MKTMREIFMEFNVSYEYYHITKSEDSARQILKNGLVPQDGYTYLINGPAANKRIVNKLLNELTGGKGRVLGIRRGSGITTEEDPETHTSYRHLNKFAIRTKDRIDPKYIDMLNADDF